jgi:hypothetical protein
MPSPFKGPVWSLIFCPPRDAIHDCLCKRLTGWNLVRYRLSRIRMSVHTTACIWRASVRSCLWHIRLQSATERPSLDLGVALSWSPDGWVENKRTLALAEGIASLWTKYPWVENADLRLYREGFDAGERAVAGTADIQTEKQTAPSS